MSCIGNETSIDNCMHFEWGSHNCNHTEDVAVRCTPGKIINFAFFNMIKCFNNYKLFN